jgi:uncharacterized SAM-binding protein YcdF (DUF218 family)
MGGPFFWIVAFLIAFLVVPPIVVGFSEKLWRRRQRALGTRRKQKMRL